jgi:polyisoprenoid-binding protein YceI
VRDRTRPLSFPGSVAATGDSEVWLDARVQINRADFGLTWNRLGLVSMDNTLTVDLIFTRK